MRKESHSGPEKGMSAYLGRKAPALPDTGDHLMGEFQHDAYTRAW